MVQIGLADRQPGARLEPLPVVVDETDQRHRRPANMRRQLGDIVETRLWRGVEDVDRTESGQSGGGGRVNLRHLCTPMSTDNKPCQRYGQGSSRRFGGSSRSDACAGGPDAPICPS